MYLFMTVSPKCSVDGLDQSCSAFWTSSFGGSRTEEESERAFPNTKLLDPGEKFFVSFCLHKLLHLTCRVSTTYSTQIVPTKSAETRQRAGKQHTSTKGKSVLRKMLLMVPAPWYFRLNLRSRTRQEIRQIVIMDFLKSQIQLYALYMKHSE